MLGGFLALMAAATFALNSATARRAVLSGSVMQGIAITVPLGIPVFLLAAFLLGQLAAFSRLTPMAVMWLSLAGIAHFVWGRYFIYRAQELIGANLAGTLQQFDLVLSLALAVIVLGETLTPARITGIVLVILGPTLVMGAHGGKAALERKAGFSPRHREGYVMVALSSIGYGLSPVLTSLGLKALGPGSSMVAGAVAYLAATAAVAVLVAACGQMRHVRETSGDALRWFAFAGVSVGVSQLLRYAALALAPVTVVQPIQRLSKLFLFFFSWLMNREHEVFDRRLMLATVISLVGAALLSMSTEAMLGLATWPSWLVDVMQWRWP